MYVCIRHRRTAIVVVVVVVVYLYSLVYTVVHNGLVLSSFFTHTHARARSPRHLTSRNLYPRHTSCIPRPRSRYTRDLSSVRTDTAGLAAPRTPGARTRTCTTIYLIRLYNRRADGCLATTRLYYYARSP